MSDNWIRLSERKPENETIVLLAGPFVKSEFHEPEPDARIVVYGTGFIDDRNGKFWPDADFISGYEWEREEIRHVTHWMPLPNPPSE